MLHQAKISEIKTIVHYIYVEFLNAHVEIFKCITIFAGKEY